MQTKNGRLLLQLPALLHRRALRKREICFKTGLLIRHFADRSKFPENPVFLIISEPRLIKIMVQLHNFMAQFDQNKAHQEDLFLRADFQTEL